MNIDWDAELDAAEASPRGRLSFFLEHADDLDFIVITGHTKDGEQVTSWSESPYIMRLGAIHMAAEALYYSANKESEE